MNYYNPFQNLELKIPKAYNEMFQDYCQTQPAGGAKPSAEDSPFERQIDMWFLAICLGAQKDGDLSPINDPRKFITGEMLSSDPQRVDLLQLLAISYTQDPWIIDSPKNVMALANDLAAAGLPELIEMLKDGNAKPIWNLTDRIMDLLSDVTAFETHDQSESVISTD